MSNLDAPTTGPTPSDMPGAKSGEPTGGESDPNQDDTLDDEDGEPTFDELLAERDKWKKQAKTNENRAKSNANKAKEYDANFEKFKAAFDREQAALAKQKTPEQLQAEADAATEARLREAEEARIEAEANLLRYQLADGVPAWAMGLITGKAEAEIVEQVEELKTNLAEYVSAQIGDQSPRRPAPNHLVGRGGPSGPAGPRQEFERTMSKLFSR